MRVLAFIFGLLGLAANAAADAHEMPVGTKHQLELGKYSELTIKAQAYPTSDGKSYVLMYGSKKANHWIVSLPGMKDPATKSLEFWYPHVKDRNIGLIVLNWEMGKASYSPRDIYRELDRVLAQVAKPERRIMLAGFSGGAANVYAVKALDFVNGKNYFPFVLVNAGGASKDHSPTDSVDTGAFGATPFEGTQWITGCGQQNPNPNREGCPAMQKTAVWIEAKGGKVAIQLISETSDRGAFYNTPENAEKLLNWFLQQ